MTTPLRGFRLSAISDQLSAVGFRLSAFRPLHFCLLLLLSAFRISHSAFCILHSAFCTPKFFYRSPHTARSAVSRDQRRGVGAQRLRAQRRQHSAVPLRAATEFIDMSIRLPAPRQEWPHSAAVPPTGRPGGIPAPLAPGSTSMNPSPLATRARRRAGEPRAPPARPRGRTAWRTRSRCAASATLAASRPGTHRSTLGARRHERLNRRTPSITASRTTSSILSPLSTATASVTGTRGSAAGMRDLLAAERRAWLSRELRPLRRPIRRPRPSNTRTASPRPAAARVVR